MSEIKVALLEVFVITATLLAPLSLRIRKASYGVLFSGSPQHYVLAQARI